MEARKKNLLAALGVGAAGIAAGAFFGIYNTKKPKGTEPVADFNLKKYLGKWYEIARFDYRFEKNLDHVTAEYSLNGDGTVKVDNKGFNVVKNKWEQNIGRAKFIGKENVGRLKVSFFGPVYASYNILSVDENYSYALVAGNSRKYLWILSRSMNIPEEIKYKYLKMARDLGFSIDKLIWTKQG